MREKVVCEQEKVLSGMKGKELILKKKFCQSKNINGAVE